MSTEKLIRKALIRSRVDEGVKALDFYFPDWRNFIDGYMLDMACNRFCILGQLKLWLLFPSSKDATELGFLHTPYSYNDEDELEPYDYENSTEEYRLLTEEWLTRL